MKLLTLFFLAASTAVSFGLDIPSSVFTMDELDEAKTKASERQKALCFIQTSSKLKLS